MLGGRSQNFSGAPKSGGESAAVAAAYPGCRWRGARDGDRLYAGGDRRRDSALHAAACQVDRLVRDGVQSTAMSASRRSLVPGSTLRAWAVLVLTLFGWQPVLGRTAQAGDSAPDVRLTLSRQTVWQGAYGWCTFSAGTSGDRGGISFRCGGGGPFGTASPGPGGGAVRQRSLSASEVATLRKLSHAALLFEGGHTGADLSASDVPFEMLIVRPAQGSRSQAAVVLVTTGNPTFATGTRKALIDWMRSLEAGLTRN